MLVEDLARSIINDTFNGGEMCASRAMVMETDAVKVRTTVLMMRVGSVIRDKKLADKELVGEEMIFIGYRGNIADKDFFGSQDECRELFLNAKASGDTELAVQKRTFKSCIEWTNSMESLRQYTDDIAVERANHLVSAFTQYRSYVNAGDYQVAEPVLPMEVIAAYVFTPKI
ncbi:MAG: hypothetical protein K6G31_05890 [Paludibacteraceae bacterium]|nr:hypothetical protein [Paludibacteraceae bacterium]